MFIIFIRLERKYCW